MPSSPTVGNLNSDQIITKVGTEHLAELSNFEDRVLKQKDRVGGPSESGPSEL